MNTDLSRNLRLLFILILLGGGVSASGVAGLAKEPDIPQPIGYVNDFADVVEPDIERQIVNICRELDEKTGTELTVATFPDIGDLNIDDFAVRVFEEWMPGQKGIDNGVLMLDAIAQRRVRIEVGYGLEGIIPDAMAGRIVREIMTPLLQQNQRGAAYLEGVAALATIVAHEENVDLESLKGRQVPQPSAERGRRGIPGPMIVCVARAILMSRFGRRRRGGGGAGCAPPAAR